MLSKMYNFFYYVNYRATGKDISQGPLFFIWNFAIMVLLISVIIASILPYWHVYFLVGFNALAFLFNVIYTELKGEKIILRYERENQELSGSKSWLYIVLFYIILFTSFGILISFTTR